MDIIKSLENLEQAAESLGNMSIPEKYRDKYEELMTSINMIKSMPTSGETMIKAMIQACHVIIEEITDGIKSDLEEQMNKIRNLGGLSGSSRPSRPSSSGSSTPRPSSNSSSSGSSTPYIPPRSGGESSGYRGTSRSG